MKRKRERLNLISRSIKITDSVCIVKTMKTFLICVFKEGIQPDNCAKTVEALGDHLILNRLCKLYWFLQTIYATDYYFYKSAQKSDAKMVYKKKKKVGIS